MISFWHQIEITQQHLGHLGELVLIFVARQQIIERLAALVFDLLAPQINQRMARWRHRHTCKLFAQQQAQRLGNRRIALVVDFGKIAAEQAVFQHFGNIGGHAGHAHAAQRLDAGLLERIKRRTGRGIHRRALAM